MMVVCSVLEGFTQTLNMFSLFGSTLGSLTDLLRARCFRGSFNIERDDRSIELYYGIIWLFFYFFVENEKGIILKSNSNVFSVVKS